MKNDNNNKVFVGLSGGVDSSVTAHLLKKDGYDVVGIHLRCWNKNGCDEKEAEDARRVAEKLEIPFYVFDLEKEYKKKVVDYMIDGYKKGITPNPDVMCNREIKFGLFLEKAIERGADFVATGHYVKLIEKKGIYHLFEGKDKNKDQSYFLWTLTQKELEHSLFPLGDLTKPEVRSIAKEVELPTAEKKDSQGICFIGKVTLKEFLEEYLPKKEGNILSSSGEILGKHDGAHFYTIGQRHGLGVSSTEPMYVSDTDIKENTVTLATHESKSLYRGQVGIVGINLIADTKIPKKVLVRIRYRQTLQKAKINIDGDSAKVIFDKPQEFVASGQSLVFYNKRGEMLGGGIIC